MPDSIHKPWHYSCFSLSQDFLYGNITTRIHFFVWRQGYSFIRSQICGPSRTGIFPCLDRTFLKVYQGYFQNIILEEITSGTEWIFFIVIIGIMFYMIKMKSIKDPEMEFNRKKELLKGLIGIILLIFLLFVSIVYILPFSTAI